jgi:hypothetical protein
MPATLRPVNRCAKIQRTCGGRRRVGFEAVQAPVPPGVSLVRVRAGVNKLVAVGRPPAQVPALQFGLGPIAAMTKYRGRDTSRCERTPSRSSSARWRGLSKSTGP